MTFLWGGQLTAQALTLVATLWMVRALGVAAFGRLASAQALAAYGVLFASAGTDLWGTRAVARPGVFPIGAFLTTRLSAGIAISCVVLAITWLTPELRTDIALIAILCAAALPTAIRFDWWLYGTGRTRAVSEATVARTAVILLLALLLLRGPGDLYLAAVIQVLGVVVGTLVSVRLGALRSSRWHWSVRRRAMRDLFVGAAPLAGAVLAAQVYYSLDTILLRLWRGDTDAGYYASAYRIIMTLIALRHLLVQAVFPYLVRTSDSDALPDIVLTIQRIGAIAGLPIAVVGAIWSRPLLTAVFDRTYSRVVPAFTILMVMVGLVFVNLAWPQLLNAVHRSGMYLWTLTAGALVNIVGNALLIPRYGMLGAAWATLAAEAAVMTIALWAVRDLVRVRFSAYLAKPFIAAATMWMAGQLLAPLWWPLAIALAVLVYLAVLLALRPLRLSDLTRFAPPGLSSAS